MKQNVLQNELLKRHAKYRRNANATHDLEEDNWRSESKELSNIQSNDDKYTKILIKLNSWSSCISSIAEWCFFNCVRDILSKTRIIANDDLGSFWKKAQMSWIKTSSQNLPVSVKIISVKLLCGSSPFEKQVISRSKNPPDFMGNYSSLSCTQGAANKLHGEPDVPCTPRSPARFLLFIFSD